MDFIAELSETLDKIKNEMTLPTSSQASAIKKSLNNLSNQLASLSLSLDNEGHLNPKNNIPVFIQSMKDAFNTFAFSFEKFSNSHKLIGGGIAFKGLLEHLSNTI